MPPSSCRAAGVGGTGGYDVPAFGKGCATAAGSPLNDAPARRMPSCAGAMASSVNMNPSAATAGQTIPPATCGQHRVHFGRMARPAH
eukprot:scaffold245763_cov31-Tisochrysis_lutea.AAC.5